MPELRASDIAIKTLFSEYSIILVAHEKQDNDVFLHIFTINRIQAVNAHEEMKNI